MDSLITVMNKLQDVFSTVGTTQKVDLPQIVVVGSQSSGKSSVLESLVGKSFLPRGTGIVTRAPLVLHLINPSELEDETDGSKIFKDWATFLHKPNVVYHDFCKVRKEIESRTEELAGDMKNITDKPIVLNVYSKRMYNLSFVDLPGLTKVPVGGQPADIESKIRDLVLKFIENPNSIILAVVTANTDPATSESLHIAKAVDPTGDRTIAVVTKIDIMDAGTDATELLSGEVIPVKLGIIGVINRSQKDINEQKSIEQSLETEEKFFQKMYPAIAHQQGTTILGKKLQYQLIKKIRETCPDLKKQLFEMHTTYTMQLRNYKEFTNNYDRSLLDLLTQISAAYVACLDGQANNSSLTKLDGGAEIANYFKTVFSKEIDEIDPLYGLSNDSIINVINNASGTSMGVFMPATAFDHIVKKQLRQFEGPSLGCVSFVHEKLMSTIFSLDTDISHEMKKYPKLMEKIVELLQTSLDKYKIKSNEAVTKMINYQEALVNTNHPDFVDAVIQSDDYKELFMYPVNMEENGHQIPEQYTNSEGSIEAEHYPINQDWTLQIKYVQLRDAGLYECQISSHPPKSIFISLKVVEAQAEIAGASEKYLMLNSPLHLECVVRQSPVDPVYIFWYHDSRMINYDIDRGVNVTSDLPNKHSALYIERASRAHSGNYTCAPSNAFPANTVIHILNGENPAAMQHGHGRSLNMLSCPSIWILIPSLVMFINLNTN